MGGLESFFLFQLTFSYMLGYLLPVINGGFILLSLLLSLLPPAFKGKSLHMIFILLYFVAGAVRGVMVGPRAPDGHFLSGGERVRFRGRLSQAYQTGPLTLLLIDRGKLSKIDLRKGVRNGEKLAVKVFGSADFYREKIGETLVGLGRVAKPPGGDRRFFFPMEMRLRGIPYMVNSTWKNLLFSGKGQEATLRDKVAKTLISALSKWRTISGGREFVISILTGRRAFMGPLREILRESGLSHLQAISGLHVGVAMVLFTFLARSLLAFAQMRGFVFDANPVSLVTAAAGTFFYAYISGMAFPVLRSFAMMIFVLCAVRNSIGSPLLAPFVFSLFVVLISHPAGIASVSFLFSFLITFFLILLFRGFPGQGTGWGLKSILVAITCYLASFPLVILFFRHVQLWSILFNILFVPLFTPVIALSLLWAAGYLVLPSLFSPLAAVPVWTAGHLLFLVDRLRRVLGGWIVQGNLGITGTGIYLCALALIILSSTPGRMDEEDK